jgi:hypothetical protein
VTAEFGLTVGVFTKVKLPDVDADGLKTTVPPIGALAGAVNVICKIPFGEIEFSAQLKTTFPLVSHTFVKAVQALQVPVGLPAQSP